MFLEILVVLATALAALAWYVKSRWNYWKDLGVFQIDGTNVAKLCSFFIFSLTHTCMYTYVLQELSKFEKLQGHYF
jgi:hypothetical protein